MRGRWIKYSDEELGWLKQRKELTRKKLTAKFNAHFKRALKVDDIKALMNRKKWNTPVHMWRYQKGHPYIVGSGAKTANKTSFKKGDIPVNTRPMWSTRITKDGYIEMKVPEKNPHTPCLTRFRLAHIWLWEWVHGLIPKGKCLAFLDDDRTDWRVENLEMISRNELARRNQMHLRTAPAEVKPTIKALAKLHVTIHERKEVK